MTASDGTQREMVSSSVRIPLGRAHQPDEAQDAEHAQQPQQRRLEAALRELAGERDVDDRDEAEEEVEAVETSEWLASEIAELPEREQIVLSLYYNDEMNLKEIGAIIGVSESRVSQILTKVVGKLRDRVAF